MRNISLGHYSTPFLYITSCNYHFKSLRSYNWWDICRRSWKSSAILNKGKSTFYLNLSGNQVFRTEKLCNINKSWKFDHFYIFRLSDSHILEVKWQLTFHYSIWFKIIGLFVQVNYIANLLFWTMLNNENVNVHFTSKVCESDNWKMWKMVEFYTKIHF